MSVRNVFVYSILPSLVLVGVLLIGYFAGRYSVINPFAKQMEIEARAYTLGNLVSEEERESLIDVYHHTEGLAKGIDDFSWAVPTMPTPFVGSAPIPGQHNNAYINSDQFRAAAEVAQPKPEGVFRIFITGGSTAYGSGASSQDKTIAGYLQALLSRQPSIRSNTVYEVFTAANPGWASTHERIIIENKLSELAPDLVIALSGNNDVHWGSLGRNILWFNSYPDDFFFKLINESYRITDRPLLPEVAPFSKKRVPPRLVSRRLLKNVKLSSYVLAQEDVDYMFFLQPTLAASAKALSKREQQRKDSTPSAYFEKCYSIIDRNLRRFSRENFRYINLNTVFDDLGAEHEIFIDSYHFGDKGNEIIARGIYSNLKTHLSQATGLPAKTTHVAPG
jgi:hypothetical protein